MHPANTMIAPVWTDFLILVSYAYPVQNNISLFESIAMDRYHPCMGDMY